MKSGRASTVFVRDLQRALRHLYNPAELAKSPLIDLLQVRQRADPLAAVRRILTEAIESLRPGADVPRQSNTWRIYHILTQRYVEQFSQREVATNLALSIRQLARLESQALWLLADHLRSRYDLSPQRHEETSALPSDPQALPVSAGNPSHEEELQWLRTSAPSEQAEAAQMVEAAVKVVAPLAQALNVRVTVTVPDGLPRLAVQVTTLRQALLNILTAAVRSAPGGQVEVAAQVQPSHVWVDVRAQAGGRADQPPAPGDLAEGLEMARELVGFSGGALEVQVGRAGSEPLRARIGLPTAEQAVVLVIDDNVDTLRLLERYLAGTRYRFAGTPDPQEALALAEELHPQTIVLDVMMAGIDGWELLGRLREHPKTRGVPIIVYTILPQEQLALALGAAALIRKPVSQAAFLAVLDQQVGPMVRGCC